MSFVSTFDKLNKGTLNKSHILRRFESLLKRDSHIESMATEAYQLTRQYFGRTMRLFAPLYLSNECVNICKYCGFSRNNPILRSTLSLDQVEAETRYLYDQGFRSILLVAGEHPKFISESYLGDCIERIHPFVPSVNLEVGPLEQENYEPLVKAGADGLIVYQETYHRDTYRDMHVSGPKRNFDWRLECPERAARAGFKRVGVGALLGLHDWRYEALMLAAHVEYLLKHCWKTFITISLPRMRPAAGEFEPLVHVNDREYTQILLAFRLCFPQIGIVLSTREPAALRDGLMPLGITMMSAGSHTEPGGYTGQGKESLHRTEKGKHVPFMGSDSEFATEQFAISDERSPLEIKEKLVALGLDPVWKDWDRGLSAVAA
ncbi:MAG: 2-iminoacetate synthase ThiH [Verrucomicrobiota bacterium]